MPPPNRPVSGPSFSDGELMTVGDWGAAGQYTALLILNVYVYNEPRLNAGWHPPAPQRFPDWPPHYESGAGATHSLQPRVLWATRRQMKASQPSVVLSRPLRRRTLTVTAERISRVANWQHSGGGVAAPALTVDESSE
jgi:hypothetical protein